MTNDYLEGLQAFLRIPSISTLPEHKPDIRRAAEFCLNELRRAGLHAAGLIERDGGNPLVYAEGLDAPRKATPVLHGHHALPPPHPPDQRTPPPSAPPPPR